VTHGIKLEKGGNQLAMETKSTNQESSLINTRIGKWAGLQGNQQMRSSSAVQLIVLQGTRFCFQDILEAGAIVKSTAFSS